MVDPARDHPCPGRVLDPCSPIVRPWPTAKKHFTIKDDGLSQPWEGRVFCNPPYGPFTSDWLEKLARHQNGIALIFARTETDTWFNWVWGAATGILFIRGRLHFHHLSGRQADHNSGAPSALVAYGSSNWKILGNSPIQGYRVYLRN